MTIITLTRNDTPSRPISLNTDFIAAVNPLRKVVPDPNSQIMATKTVYSGAEVVLSNGTKYNVLEDYQSVMDQLVEPVHKDGPLLPEVEITSVEATPEHKIIDASGNQAVPNTLSRDWNLRDDAAEKEFIAQLKDAGVPVGDNTTLAVNIPQEFEDELAKEAAGAPVAEVPEDTIEPVFTTASAVAVPAQQAELDKLRASAATQAGDPDVSGVPAPKPAKKAAAKKAAPKPVAEPAEGLEAGSGD